jgi:hypothetical protein
VAGTKTRFSVGKVFCLLGLVGAVGIENNSTRNFKDLEEMHRSVRTLKRHNAERKGILIGPPMAPRFPSPNKFLHILQKHIATSASV